MAKARIGHFVEAQVLEALGVDYIDESEVLTPADEANHIDKHAFKVPFVCGCRNLGEALRRINEGAAMMRTKGEAGTGNVVEAVRQLRDVLSEIRKLQGMREDELFVAAKELQAPYELVKQVAADGKLPVVNFVAGGISTPADAALVMQLGSEGVFVGSGIFKSEDPARMANAIVQATTHFDNASIIAEVSKGLGAPMRGIAMEAIPEQERLAVAAGRAARHAPRSRPPMRIGVLALQGDFREHLTVLDAIGVEGVRCGCRRTSTASPDHPAGRREHDDAPLDRALGARRADPRLAATGAPLYGTCAGMIVLSKEIVGGEQPVLPLLDVTVQRNAFGGSSTRSRPTCRSDPRRSTRPCGLHPGAGHRIGRARRRRARSPRRRPNRRRARAERDRHLVPSRARRRDALPPPRGDDGRRARRPGRGCRPPAAPDPARPERLVTREPA
jgi:pyridoxal 5'-phosphate synthase pdxS subunit